MESLQVELNAFERSLPSELKLTSHRLVFMAHSREAGAYVGLHGLWMLCHCDLYRFCVPGIRESISKNALTRTPLDFIDNCQRACFDTAVRLCTLWSDLYHLEATEFFGDEFLAVSIYQVTQILHHLPHLMPEEGDNSPSSLKAKLVEALQLAMPVKRVFSSAINCLRDCEHLINAFGHGPVSQSSPDSSAVAGVDPAREHLASRHSVIPHLYRDQEPDRGGVVPMSKIHRPGERGMLSSVPNTNGPLDTETGEQETEPGFSDMFLFDPFNMHLNDYYDPRLDFPFS